MSYAAFLYEESSASKVCFDRWNRHAKIVFPCQQPETPMLKTCSLAVCLTSSAFALSSLSGMVQDTSKGPIDGAIITVWDAETGKGVRTSSSMGSFSLSGLTEGDYLFKVENNRSLPAIGALHLASDESHNINVVALSISPGNAALVGAGSPLRNSVRPARSSAKPPKVRPAQVTRKVMPVYPDADRTAGVAGVVKIAMIILPNGTVNDLVVLSAPNDNLAIAALLAVKRWQYSPTYLDDQPVEASLTVDVTFQKR
jgi:TonB family protein